MPLRRVDIVLEPSDHLDTGSAWQDPVEGMDSYRHLDAHRARGREDNSFHDTGHSLVDNVLPGDPGRLVEDDVHPCGLDFCPRGPIVSSLSF